MMRVWNLLLILFTSFMLSCSQMGSRSVANIEGTRYSCQSFIYSILVRKKPPSITILEAPRNADQYFDQLLVPQPTYGMFVERTFKAPAFIRWLRRTRVKKRNARPFSLAAKEFMSRIEPKRIHTFVILDGEFIFAESGPETMIDLLSKHVQLSNKAEVQYAGEFYVEDGVLYINNASGTYMPDGKLLPKVKQFMVDNFELPEVVTIDITKTTGF